jgi:ribosomal-protein-serine acetyltransferase
MTIRIDDNILLEKTSARHAEGLFKAVDGNRSHLSAFLPWVSSMKTVSDMTSYVKSCEELHEQGKEVSFVILHKGTVAGRIGLHHMNVSNRNAAIGYWLDKQLEGKGIIVRSCVELISLGFTELGLHRIEIRVAVHNARSQAIPIKLGFRKEGVLREAEFVNGEYFDLVVFSLLEKEWTEHERQTGNR